MSPDDEATIHCARMRTLAAILLLAACGSSGARTTEIASDEEVAPARADAKTIAAALRVAEVQPDGTVLVSAEGGALTAGAGLRVAILETFDGEPVGHRVLTAAIDGPVDAFLDSDRTQVFLVCADSRGGEPPALYRGHVTGGELAGLAPHAAAIAWPLELDLDYAPATGAEGLASSAEPYARDESEAIQLDADPDLERLSHVVQFHDANVECPFPYETWEILFDDRGERLATRPPEGACFAQIPLFHDMACCSEPACTPGDPRALCRWPPSFQPRFEPDLAPARFEGRTFVANTRGPIAGALRSADAAVWIRHRRSFEGEVFVWFHADGDVIVEAGSEYLYHCAY